jgi:hypothetical protein
MKSVKLIFPLPDLAMHKMSLTEGLIITHKFLPGCGSVTENRGVHCAPNV